MIHVVSEGDTLYKIAKQHQISLQRIISDNGLHYPYTLAVGEALLILKPRQIHVVMAGDTIYSIARRFGITEEELLQRNP